MSRSRWEVTGDGTQEVGSWEVCGRGWLRSDRTKCQGFKIGSVWAVAGRGPIKTFFLVGAAADRGWPPEAA